MDVLFFYLKKKKKLSNNKFFVYIDVVKKIYCYSFYGSDERAFRNNSLSKSFL